MALHIRHPEADRLARQLRKEHRQSLTEVVIEALKDRLHREEGRAASPRLKERIMAISRRAAAMPRRTGRSAERDYWLRRRAPALMVIGTSASVAINPMSRQPARPRSERRAQS